MLKFFWKNFKTVNTLAIPVLSGILVETVFGIADKAIIGRTNVEGFAAVSIAATIIYLLTGSLGVLALAFSISFAKAVGKNNHEKASRLFNTSITLVILIGVLFEIAVLFFSDIFFEKFYHLSGLTLQYASGYMKIASVGVGINMGLFIMSSYFKNLRKTQIYFYSTLLSLIINFVVDYILVFGKFGFPEMGVKGAAIGTIIGLFASLIVYIIGYLKNKIFKFHFKVSKDAIKEIFILYIPLLGQDLIESTIFILLLTSIVTTLDVQYIASYSLIETILSFLLMPVYTYSGAALTLVTQEFGKKDYLKTKLYPMVSLVCSLISIMLLGGLFILFPSLIGLVTDNGQLLGIAQKIMPLAIGIQVLNVFNQVYKYCLQGIEQEKWVLLYSFIISTISSILIYCIVMWSELKIYGVYIGLGINYFLLGFGYLLRYYKIINNSNCAH